MDLAAFHPARLIYAADLDRAGVDARERSQAVGRGQLARLRRGVYVRPGVWADLTPREQHLLRVDAVVAASTGTPVLAGRSAAALWGLPLDDFPVDVVILDKWRGGGRSEPGVRRTSRGATTAKVVGINGLSCTTLARTALDSVRGLAFADAVKYLDWCLWVKNPIRVTRDELVAEASTMKVSAALWRAVDFATDLSDSVGESEARAVMWQLGFPAPQLQRRFVDSQGAIYPDFYFPEADAAVEFDGKVKYSRDQYTGGDPVEVLWREKKREDRLRRQVRIVVRVLTEDVRSPAELERKLSEAGIHRTLGGSRARMAGATTPANRR